MARKEIINRFIGLVACGIVSGVVAWSASDTALADTLPNNQVIATYTYMGGAFSVPSGDSSTHPLTFANITPGAAVTIPVQLTCASCSIGTTVQVNGSPAWLRVTTGGDSGSSLLNNVQVQSSAATTLNVKVITASLTPGSTYNGSITITGPQGTSPVTLNVTATVGGSSVLSATPSSLSFTAVQGSNIGSPASSLVQISSTAGTLNYTSTGSTADGNSWLLLQNANGTTGGTGITVSVNPSTLPAGVYNGTITVQSSSTSDFVSIPVSLTVTATATLSVTPSSLSPFLYQTGQGFPASQQLMVVSSAGNVNFSVTMSPAVSWLIVTPMSGSASTTATPITLSVNPTGLGVGPQSTTVFVTPSGGPAVAAIPVNLVVSSNPLLRLSSTALTFTSQFAGISPADQQVQVTTSGGSGTVGFTATSDSSWLTVSPGTGSATTTATPLTIHVNPQSLQVGNYTGVITVHPSNGDQYSEAISVALTVSSTSQVVAGPSQLVFSYELGLATPLSQLVQVTSLGQPASFTLASTTSNCGTGWLGVSPNSFTTPATLAVSVQVTGMAVGTCSGNVVISYNNGTGTTMLSIPVVVNVSNNGTPLLNVSFPQTANGFGLEIVQQNSAAISRSISLTSTDPAMQVAFSVNTSSGPTTWLFAAAPVNTTPQTLTVQIVPTGLGPGTYNGTLQIVSAGLPGGALTMPMTLIVNPSVTVSVAPASLSFTQAQGGPTPSAQSITFTTSGGTGATFTANASTNQGGLWLKLSSNSGAASGSITASLDAAVVSTLSVGTYTGQITFAFQNASTGSVSIPVTLTITPPQTVNPPSPASLNFNYTVGGQTPASQTLNITSIGGGVQISVGTTSSGWLSATPASGTTPQTITVVANTQGITSAGTLNGSIAISAPGVLATPIQVPVTLTVAGVLPPQNLAVTGNANNIPGAIAPGELITIKGANLGPATPVNFTINSQGGLDSTLGGVQVLFDGIPGTPYFVSSTQINVTVPYEIAGRASTNIVVSYQGQQSAPISQTVAAAAPAIFTLNGSGSGQAWVRNQNGAINGPVGGVNTSGGVVPTTPATAGQVVSLIATGGGNTNPPSATGSVNSPTATVPLAGWTLGSNFVTATIGGVNAPVQFAGAYPSLITGLLQVNVTIPPGVSGNALPIVITINQQQSLGGAGAPTVAVQ